MLTVNAVCCGSFATWAASPEALVATPTPLTDRAPATFQFRGSFVVRT